MADLNLWLRQNKKHAVILIKWVNSDSLKRKQAEKGDKREKQLGCEQESICNSFTVPGSDAADQSALQEGR